MKITKIPVQKKVSLDFPKSSSYNIYAGMQNSKTLIFRAYKTLLRKNRQEYRNFWQESSNVTSFWGSLKWKNSFTLKAIISFSVFTQCIYDKKPSQEK